MGALVTPAISEFVQIINTGSHWVCLSTIATSPGTVKVYDMSHAGVVASGFIFVSYFMLIRVFVILLFPVTVFSNVL